MEISIPGRDVLRIDYLLLDANGTISADGLLIDGVSERLARLAGLLKTFIITADTFGKAGEQFSSLPVELRLLDEAPGARQKLDFIRSLGPECCAAVGNGENDRLMLKEAALGIAVIGDEGASLGAVQAADVLVNDILSALDLLLNTRRLTATLRK